MARSRLGAARRWQVTACLALLLPLGLLSFLNRATSLHGDDGVRWVEAGGSLRAAGVEAGGPGESAGIQPGDSLVSIDGRPARSQRELRDLLWGRGGVASTYLLRRDGTLVTRRLVPALNGEENRFFYYLCVVGILGLGAGCLAAWRLPREPASLLLLAVTAAFYLILVFSPGGGGGTLDWILYWGDLAGRLLVAPLVAHFVLRVAAEERKGPGRGLRIVLYLPAAALLALNLYLIPFRGVLAFQDPVGALRWKDRLEILVISLYGAAAALILLVRFWTATRSRVRWRLKWLTVSTVAGFLPLALLYGIPVAFGIPPGELGEVAVFPICLVPLGFATALFQERSVDLDKSLRGAVRWSLGTALFLGGALALSWSLGNLPGGLGRAGFLGEVVLPLAVSAVTLVALRRPLRRLSDSLLGGRPPDAGRALLEFRSVLNGEVRLEELGAGLLAKLRETYNVEPVRLLVREGEGPVFRSVPSSLPIGDPAESGLVLEEGEVADLAPREWALLAPAAEGERNGLASCHRDGLRYLFPLAVGRDLKALLLAGPHRDGSPLQAEELEVLAALAAQAARSIEGARLYREIQERIRKEERLRCRSQGILEASRIGILLADGRGIITQANRSAGEILGFPDCSGKPLEAVLPRGLLMLLDRSERGERTGGGPGRLFRYSFGSADGRARTVNVTRAPLGAGEEGGQVYTLDDVTEEVRREQKMFQQEHLASMGLLASQVAHEVNTPLTGIASYAQILMSRMSPRVPEMDLLRKIEAQAFRAARIAGSVLSFSRRRAEDLHEVLDPGPVVAECLTLFETQLKGKKIRMTLERAASLPPIRGHRGRIQQAVLNLLMNAAEALPAGGEVRLGMDREGEHLRIRVTDNGVGIPPEILPKIFEPFFTARRDGTGTGLGLAVVRQVIEEHRGRVVVESVSGAGSTFSLLLPAEASSVREVSHGA